MVQTAILPYTNQTVQVFHIPIEHIYKIKRWFISGGAKHGKDWDWWPEPSQITRDTALLGSSVVWLWVADPQLALMFALRWS